LPDNHQVTYVPPTQINNNQINTNNNQNGNIYAPPNAAINTNSIFENNNTPLIDYFNNNDELLAENERINQRAEIQEILDKNSDTTLMAYFKLNEMDEHARQFLYRDIPKHYSYDKKHHTWKKRSKPKLKVVGRIYTVHPKDVERFSLRLLLNHIPGATSFNFLRIYNNITYSSFHEVAIARGLMADSNEALTVLEEAYNLINSAQKFREFFTHYLINTPNIQVAVLWSHFKDKLSEDFIYHIRQIDANFQPNENVYLLAVNEIKKILEAEGYNLSRFNQLPQPNQQQINDLLNTYNNNLVYPQFSHVDSDYSNNVLNTNLPLLNDDQRLIFNSITQDLPQGKFF